jgi:hypothetical protein
VLYDVTAVGQVLKGDFCDAKVVFFDEFKIELEVSTYLHHAFDLEWLADAVPQKNMTFEEHSAELKK